jgi:enoyl-CoA hydratase/carnithine racemase
VSDQKNLMSDDHGSVIHYEAGQHVARITLNRPGKLNALNSALVDGLQAALSRAAAQGPGKVVFMQLEVA